MRFTANHTPRSREPTDENYTGPSPPTLLGVGLEFHRPIFTDPIPQLHLSRSFPQFTSRTASDISQDTLATKRMAACQLQHVVIMWRGIDLYFCGLICNCSLHLRHALYLNSMHYARKCPIGVGAEAKRLGCGEKKEAVRIGGGHRSQAHTPPDVRVTNSLRMITIRRLSVARPTGLD